MSSRSVPVKLSGHTVHCRRKKLVCTRRSERGSKLMPKPRSCWTLGSILSWTGQLVPCQESRMALCRPRSTTLFDTSIRPLNSLHNCVSSLIIQQARAPGWYGLQIICLHCGYVRLQRHCSNAEHKDTRHGVSASRGLEPHARHACCLDLMTCAEIGATCFQTCRRAGRWCWARGCWAWRTSSAPCA